MPGARLRMAIGIDTQVLGEVICITPIGNVTMLHKFLAALIVDEVITGADFLLGQGITIYMHHRMYKNVEPLSIVHKH